NGLAVAAGLSTLKFAATTELSGRRKDASRGESILKFPSPGADNLTVMHRLSGKLGLLGRFSSLSLVAFVLLGLALAHTLKSQVRERSLANGRQTAEILAKSSIQPRLAAVDLQRGLTPKKVRTLDRAVR